MREGDGREEFGCLANWELHVSRTLTAKAAFVLFHLLLFEYSSANGILLLLLLPTITITIISSEPLFHSHLFLFLLSFFFSFLYEYCCCLFE